MEKETVIIRLRATIDFSQETISWLDRIANTTDDKESDNGIWFAKERGKCFLEEHKYLWEQVLTAESDQVIQRYFLDLGFDEKLLPKTKITEAYFGSWVIEAAVTIAGSVGWTYTLIEAISRIPDIIEGLNKLKDSIVKGFHRKVDDKAIDLLTKQAQDRGLPSPPSHNVMIVKDFILDARPLTSLKPSEMKSHEIHLRAAVSQDVFTLILSEPLKTQHRQAR